MGANHHDMERHLRQFGIERLTRTDSVPIEKRKQLAVKTTRPRFVRSMTVFVYVNTSKQVGDPEHLKVFANPDAAEAWFAENDPEGVAFEYEVLE
jgi:hypothetical protein